MRLCTPAALLSVVASLLPLAATAHAQSVILSADATQAPYHSVVHLTASGPAGTVTFSDNGIPIAAVPVSTNGLAVLGTATLTPGLHTLTAASALAVSSPVAVTITTAQPSSFLFSSDSPTLFLNNTVRFTVAGLPARATGSITYAQDGVDFAGVSLTGPPAYQAVGDSITAGYQLADPTTRYANLFSTEASLPAYLNISEPGAAACDILTHYLLPQQTGPTQDASPLYSLMIGSTDVGFTNAPLGEPNFAACHLAALAWLAMPREYKVLPGDPALTILSGSWSLPPAALDSTYATLYNSSGSGAASFTLTSNGGPLYLWYLLADHTPGAFTVTLDGIPTGVTYATNPAVPINSVRNPDSTAFALLRLPVPPGPHTLRVDVVSGTVGLRAAGTPPSRGAASVHPTVLASDIPNQDPTLTSATPANIERYSADAFANVAVLQSDGLDVRPVPTHSFLPADHAFFIDYAHPNILGHQRLADAFQAVFGSTPTAPFQAPVLSVPAYSLLLTTLGSHTFTAAYSGNAAYPPYTASTTVNVVPDSQSITTLAAPATTFNAAQPATLTATIFPPNPGAAVTLLEGAQVLATAPLAYNTAAFALTGLPPGIHTLHAAYGGDPRNAASVSPPLAIQILQNTASIRLTASASELAYAVPLTLSATVLPATASGTVLFSDSYTPNRQVNGQALSQNQALGQSPLAAGSAAFTLPTLAPGTHTITATYSGDANNLPATSTAFTTLVDTIPTATTLAGSPASFGTPSTFTAAVTPGSSTGTITFTDSLSAVPVQAALLNGTATWTTSALPPGPHAISATYSGDATHAASASPALPTTIPRATSATTLLAPGNGTLYAGNPVVLTATLSPANATGTVLFSDRAAGVLGQAAVASGLATLTLSSLPVALYSLIATYSGDSSTLPSSSATIALRVLSATTATTLTAPANATYGSSVTLSATVAPVPAGGLLRFLDNGNLLGSTSLAQGTATFVTPTLSAGSHTLTAVFTGDGTYNPSTGTATLTVTPAASSTAISLAQQTVLAGSPALVNVRVDSIALPTGIVTLRSGSTVLAAAPLANGNAGHAYATLSVPTPAAGTFTMTAFYSGDPNTAASDSSSTALSYTVLPRAATGTLTLSSKQVPPQTPVTLTAAFTSPATSGPALTPTGTVTFRNGAAVLAVVPLDSTGQATTTLIPAALGTSTLTAVYAPTGIFTATPVAPATLTVTPPLALSFQTSTLALASTLDTILALTPLSGYQGAVTTQCTSPAAFLACTVEAPATLTGPATAKIHLAVTQQTAALPLGRTALTLAVLLPLCLVRRRRRPTLLALLLAATTSLIGCGEGGTFGQPPAGTYLVHITATAANTPATATLTVTIH